MISNINDITFYLLIIPSIFRIIFPGSVDGKFTIFLNGMPFCLYDICLLLCLFISLLKNKLNSYCVYFFLCFETYILLQLIFRHYDDLLFASLNDIYFLLPIVASVFALKIEIKEKYRYIFYFVEFYLFMQVYLYSFGILTFRQTQNAETVYGIMRIGTTAGAATGTSVLVFLCYIITDFLEKNRMMKSLNFVLSFATVIVLQTKSVIVCYLVVLLYNILVYMKSGFFRKVLPVGIVSGMIVYVFSQNNILRYIFARFTAEDLLSGRKSRYIAALSYFNDSPLFGYGIGNIYPIEILQENGYIVKNYVAVHNTYLLLLVENGIIGVLLLFAVAVIGVSYFSVDWKKKKTIVCILLLFCVVFNTETIIINVEYIILICVVLRLVIREKQQ